MGRKSNDKKEKDLIDEVVKRLKTANAADDHNRKAAIADLRFINVSQWSDEEIKRRKDKGRPYFTLNFLGKFVNQVVGDMLHNTPSIGFVPVDSLGDVRLARIRQGLASDIQYQSAAIEIYDYAAKHMVECGYGAWRVLTRYTEDNPFLQEIYLEKLKNPLLAFMDPSAKSKYFADAQWGLILEKLDKEVFTDTYPDAAIPDGKSFGPTLGISAENWYDGDTVTVAEYFRRDHETKTLCLLEDGRVVSEEDFAELHKKWGEKQGELIGDITSLAAPSPAAPGPSPGSPVTPPVQPQGLTSPGLPQASPGLPPSGPPLPGAGNVPPPQKPQGPSPAMLAGAKVGAGLKHLGPEPIIVKRRDTEITVIRHWIVTAAEILKGGLEGDKVAGKYIPIVLVRGPEINVEGKTYISSLTRHAKDAQKLNNYWQTAAAETIALAPKAPWVATPKQIEGHELSYAAANIENNPVLLYNHDPLVPGPPQRNPPAQPPVAIFEQIRRAEENIKSVIGLFSADVGAAGSEQTGAAIRARQRPGDIGTYEFTKILYGAVEFTGRIINDMFPEIYDSQRDVRVRHIDESESFVPINTTVGDALDQVEKNPERYKGLDLDTLRTLYAKNGKDAKYNDMTVGRYNVRANAGPSYATQRVESANHLLELVRAMPQQMAMAADLIVGNLDFKDADELASRLRRPLVAQGITKPREGEPPPKPVPPAPAVQIQQIKAQSAAQLAQMKIQHAQLELEIEKLRYLEEQLRAQKEMQGKAGDAQEKQVRLQLDAERIRLEKARFLHDHTKDTIALDTERRKVDGDIAVRMMGHAAKTAGEVENPTISEN